MGSGLRVGEDGVERGGGRFVEGVRGGRREVFLVQFLVVLGAGLVVVEGAQLSRFA